ncbi:vitamin B12 dependent-methionine synthase activation domain-containing protein [Spirosoma areae]
MKRHNTSFTLHRQWEARQDDYQALLATDLGDLYRSAVADYLHYRLRRFIWAYCDDDDLSNEELLEGMHQGIRVEIGSPSCPDRTAVPPLLHLLAIEDQTFTGVGAACSALSECGFFFAHPKSRHYPLGPVMNQTPPSV